MDTIGSRVKLARKKKGLTQTDIRNLVGISSGNLSDIENNKSMPSSSALISLSRELGISIDWILTGKDYQQIEESKAAGNLIAPEDIELLAKIHQLSSNNRVKIEGVIEGLLLAQGDESRPNKQGRLPASTNGENARGEAAARASGA